MCILCGRCLDVCPVFLASGKEELSPKAKHTLLQALQTDILPDSLAARQLADLCVSCGRCARICRQGLSVPRALSTLRARHPSWAGFLWQRWITHGAFLWPSLASLARMAPDTLPIPDLLRRMLHAGMTMRQVPAEPWFQITKNNTPQKKTALIFAGCTATYIRPHWRTKAEKLLHMLGYASPAKPSFICCGQTLEHAGLCQTAHEARQRNVQQWRKAGKPMLITTCASCTYGLQSYAQDKALWHHTDSIAQWLDSLVPLCDLLIGCDVRPLPHAPLALHYHQPCHAPVAVDPDKTLLTRLAAALPPTSADTTHPKRMFTSTRNCCGMGGSMQIIAPQLCQEVNTACWKALDKLTAPTSQECSSTNSQSIVTGCSACTLQLAHTAPSSTEVYHWLDIIQPRG